MFTIQELFNVMKPILIAFEKIWSFLQLGVWDAYQRSLEFFSFDGVNIFSSFQKWVGDVLANVTTVDEFLNQYTLLTFSLGTGLIAIIVITIIGWVGDKVGL